MVSSSSRRVPACIAARLRARRLERPHADRLALVDERRVCGHGRAACPGSVTVCGSVPIVHARSPLPLERPGRRRQLGPQPRPHRLAHAREVLALRRARRAASSSTRNVMRRCGGSRARSERRQRHLHAAHRSICSAMSSSSGRAAAAARASTAAAVSGTGTSGRRSSFGNARISVVTSSSRSPATSHSKRSARSCPSAASGTCTVTPSSLGARLEPVAELQLEVALLPRLRPGARVVAASPARRAARAGR